MREFVSMRKFLSQNHLLFNKFDHIDKKLLQHDHNFKQIFDEIESKGLPKKQGIFFEGQMFDARKFVSDLIKTATKRIILIDNYVDDSVLTLFSTRKSEVKVTVYTKHISKKLKQDLEIFNSEYPLIEIKQFDKSHDRFLIIDNETYLFGASIKDLGKKWFGFSKFDKNSVQILDKLSN